MLQVLALDIGTDMFPALAFGAEPPATRCHDGRHQRNLVDQKLLRRSFGVLGATQALVSLAAFFVVLGMGGWVWGAPVPASLLAAASGTAFAAIAIGQMANAFACRSETRSAWSLPVTGNPLLLIAVASELALLVGFLAVPPVADLLGGSWPPMLGWLMALLAAPVVLLVDAASKRLSRRPGRDLGPATD